MVTGFHMWLDHPDNIGTVILQVEASRGATRGQVDLIIGGRFAPQKQNHFSYSATVAIVESTVEGIRFTRLPGYCSRNQCPVDRTAPNAVPAFLSKRVIWRWKRCLTHYRTRQLLENRSRHRQRKCERLLTQPRNDLASNISYCCSAESLGHWQSHLHSRGRQHASTW